VCAFVCVWGGCICDSERGRKRRRMRETEALRSSSGRVKVEYLAVE
jgi:hypothetical protein